MPTTWRTATKAGESWGYDQQGISYDALADDVTNLTVFYEALGNTPSFDNQSKS